MISRCQRLRIAKFAGYPSTDVVASSWLAATFIWIRAMRLAAIHQQVRNVSGVRQRIGGFAMPTYLYDGTIGQENRSCQFEQQCCVPLWESVR